MSHQAMHHSLFTYKDYCTWPEEERWELIHGEAYNMTPAPSRLHQQVSAQLTAQIVNYLQGKQCRLFAAPFDVRLPHKKESDDDIDTVVQPDISVVCDLSKLDAKGCRGAPDWIIEILSPYTAAKDQKQKRELYEQHGVKEYWLVHPHDKTVTIYQLAKYGYGKPDVQVTEGTTRGIIFPELEIQWDMVFMGE